MQTTPWPDFLTHSYMQRIRWHIGCSGFYYKEWKEVFYPKGLAQKNWFTYYAQHFTTLEINNTFYRFPEQKLFDNWYAKAPADFCFSVKVPQTITHLQKFNGTENLLNEFYAIATQGLKEKLGAVLFQLPPQLPFAESLLQNIINQLNPSHQNVIEFCNQSWWRPQVFAALQQKGIGFCGVSYPGLPAEAVTGLPFAYYRFHGVPKLYYSAYTTEFIERIAAQLSAPATKEAYVYFNNTASAAALANARFLQTLAGATN